MRLGETCLTTFRQDGRCLLFLIVAGYFVALAVSGLFMDYERFWQYLGVPANSALFGDLHHITNGWECVRLGHDVRVDNPCNGSPLVYPGLWIKMQVFGLGPDTTIPLGIVITIWFYFSTYLLLPVLSVKESLLYAAIICSPAAMLAVERGNIDMIMFSLTVLAVWMLSRNTRVSAYMSAVPILLASFLKLFPIAAAYATLHQKTVSRAIMVFTLICVAFAGFLALTIADIRTVSGIVPEPPNWAYGAKTIGLQLSETMKKLTGTEPLNRADTITKSLLIAGFVIGYLAARRLSPVPPTATAGLPSLAFQAGASTYTFTYIAASNFDYRLIFLIMTLPQVLLWLRDSRTPHLWHKLALASIVGSTWFGFFFVGAYHSAINVFVNLSVDQFMEWHVFVYFVCMLFQTAPPWIRKRIALVER